MAPLCIPVSYRLLLLYRKTLSILNYINVKHLKHKILEFRFHIIQTKLVAKLSHYRAASWPVNLVACILQCSVACNCPIGGTSLRINQQIWLTYLAKYCLLSSSKYGNQTMKAFSLHGFISSWFKLKCDVFHNHNWGSLKNNVDILLGSSVPLVWHCSTWRNTVPHLVVGRNYRTIST